MQNAISEASSKILAYGAFLITVTVVTTGLNEPVNAPKMLLLSIVAFALAPLCFSYFQSKRVHSKLQKETLLLFTAATFFVLWLFISNVFSAAPVEHGFYGTYGRNTGTLTYLCLSILILAATFASATNRQQRVLNAFFLAGFFNVVYFVLTLFGFELFNWYNPKKAVLGTFGNSNFVGAFMGIFVVFLFGYLFQKDHPRSRRLLSLLLIPLALFEVIQSKATQGILVSGLGLAVILFYYLRFKVSRFLLIIYSFLLTLVFTVSIAGILQVGPLKQYLYKLSVSLRGEYWAAGWQMGLNHPLLGVGPDSYGFNYRTFRSQNVIDLAGPGTTSDAAHNVFIDIFAYGGVPLLIAYLGIQVLIIIRILAQFRAVREFDPIYATLVACWLGYLAQSIVSINQIGVAIWGWIFGGLIFGYGTLKPTDKSKDGESKNTRLGKAKKDMPIQISAGAVLTSIFSSLIGLFIGLQPLLSDASYFSALQKREIFIIDQSARKWPTNPVRLGDAATILSQNGFKTQSLDLARFAVGKYPHSFLSWFVFYKTNGITKEEEKFALDKLRALDPLNEEFD